MEYLAHPGLPVWDTAAPTTPVIVHESEALAVYPKAADYWQFALMYGAPPNPTLIGDLGNSSNKRRVRIVAPAYATHAQVFIVASGTGVVSIQEVGASYAIEVPIQGNADGALLEDDAVIATTEPKYATPSGITSRLVLLNSGNAPCYTTDLEFWKTAGSGGLTIWGISLRFTRLAKTIS